MLKNKVAIVTGGSKGIGYAIAESLANNGAKVVVADIDTKNGEEAAKRLGGVFINCDISNEADVRRLMEETTKRFSVLNILVNTAKIYIYKNMKNLTTQQWASSVSVNLHGFFHLTKHALPLLEETKGVIVEVASGLGAPLERESTPYCVTEAATFALVKNIARSHSASGVRALAVNPGPIDTPLLHVAFEGDVAKYGGLNPSKRVGSPREVADLVTFLVSDKARYITGAVYNVDGGEAGYQ